MLKQRINRTLLKCVLFSKVLPSAFKLQRYRSGHNGADSKSVRPKGLVGSNPTRSAITKNRMDTLIHAVLFYRLIDCDVRKYTLMRFFLHLPSEMPSLARYIFIVEIWLRIS